MKSKLFKLSPVLILLFWLLSSCSTTTLVINTVIPPTLTITASPAPTSTLTTTPLPPTPTLIPETAFIKGVTLNNFGPKLDTTYAQSVITEYIIPAGANYVVLIPTCWMTNPNDTNVDCSNNLIVGEAGAILPPVPDEELINAIQYLHSVGLRVIIKPSALIKSRILNNLSGPQLGTNWDQESWQKWFDSYIIFISHYAQIAEDYNVDLLVIGCELEDTTRREDDWRRVIAAVRDVYHGPITYAANAWQFEAGQVKFWDALDYIGTNAYNYFFGPINGSTVADMKQAYQPYLQRLEKLSNDYGKQVIFTEFGAMSEQGYNSGTMRDWMATSYNGQEQADHYTAFFESIIDMPWVKGVILWDVYTSPLQGGPNDISYSFIGKPAEEIVRQYFGGLPITPTAIPNFVEKPAETMLVYDEELSSGWTPWYQPDAKSFPDFRSPNPHSGSFSIRVAYSEFPGLWLTHNPPLDMSKYKWLEFYIMVGKHQPKHLLAVFEDWTTGINLGSRMALVNDPKYIEGGQYQPGTWQRVRIPLVDLSITNQKSTGFDIMSCAWPCDFDYETDDVYIDDIRLIAGE
ncbi:MAG: hypothetical protein FJZ86_18610 [Chloroflexi bacterium]|nr:hypothetical protein [Chloroflexota bacterium]